MNIYLKKFGFVAILAALLNPGLIAGAWADDDDNSEIEAIVFFGDSLSDAGNIYALTGQITLPPWPLIPSAPYDFGNGFQFSNDPTWPQQFARRLGTPRSGMASLFNPGKNGNYAFGGARVGTDLGDPTSGASQIARYLADNNGEAEDDDTLYVLQFGGNDIRDALVNPPSALNIITRAVQRKLALIAQLHDAGARRFLVVDVPDLGKAPVIKILGASAEASFLSELFNYLLESGLQTLEDSEHGLDGIEIDRYSFFGVLNSIVANPSEFGIENTNNSCLQTFPPGNAVCPNPEAFLFWDGLHPTGRVHEIVGNQVAVIFLGEDDDDDDDNDDDDDDDDDD